MSSIGKDNLISRNKDSHDDGFVESFINCFYKKIKNREQFFVLKMSEIEAAKNLLILEHQIK